ncbi:MAG: hypothetical protein M3R15_14535 [Acidobacteriota bacterium]|nr:hypothetical protein [Acidobacteriota bacterium]
MSEEITQDLRGRSFEERVLAEFAALRNESATQRHEFTAMRTEFTTMRTEFASLRVEFAALRQEVRAVDTRLVSLEEKVDARLRETRPIWEGMQAALEDIQYQMKLIVADLFKTRARVERLEDRLRPPAA